MKSMVDRRSSRAFQLTDSPLPVLWSNAEPGSVLVFDGIFLHRPELRNAWSLSIFLDASFDVTIPR